MRRRMLSGFLGALLLMVALAASASAAPLSPRIVGGQDALSSEWPWVVALLRRDRPSPQAQFCGGTAIAPQLVLTAAHCLKDTDPAAGIDVLAGTVDLTQGGQRLPVVSATTAPGWDPRLYTHDLALLQLGQPMTSVSSLPRLAAATDSARWAAGQQLGVAGWGVTVPPSTYPNLLQQVSLPVLPSLQCDLLYAAFEPSRSLCVGGGERDSCFGDSGGPLVAGSGAEGLLVGVVSYGPSRCAVVGQPGVYTLVPSEQAYIQAALGTQPQPPTPPQVALSWGRLTCPGNRCLVRVRAQGQDRARVQRVRLVIARPATRRRPAYQRTVSLPRVATDLYRGRLLLPLGTIRLRASAWEGEQQLGDAIRLRVRVTLRR